MLNSLRLVIFWEKHIECFVTVMHLHYIQINEHVNTKTFFFAIIEVTNVF